jgi:hypothetical protein
MGDHARPRISGRHRKPGMPARAAAATAAAATGTATAGVIILAGHASAAPVVPAAFSHAAGQVSTTTEENVIHQQLSIRLRLHLDHLRHVGHLRHLELIKQEKAQHVNLAVRTSFHGGGTLSCSGLEALWEAAGGSHGEAFLAAEIAMAESGGNQYAVSPGDDVGYWQINRPSWGAMASTDPIVNAESAVKISNDGTNFTPWTTYTHGLYVGRC